MTLRMLWLTLAAQVLAPQPVNFMSWWSPAEMPGDVARAGITRFVPTRTTVGPNGSILRCDVESTSGNERLDLLTCAIIVKRGKFDAAHDAIGNAAYGVYRATVVWAVAPVGTPPDQVFDKRAARVDIRLTVNQLPGNIKSPAQVGVMFAVDEQGRPSDCVAEPPAGTPGANLQLAPLACRQLVNSYTAKPATNERGVIVPSIQDAKVEFVAERRK